MPPQYGTAYKGIVDCTLRYVWSQLIESGDSPSLINHWLLCNPCRTIKTEGLSALYKGLGPALTTTVPYIALQMTFYDLAKRNLPAHEGNSFQPSTTSLEFLSVFFVFTGPSCVRQTVVFLDS